MSNKRLLIHTTTTPTSTIDTRMIGRRHVTYHPPQTRNPSKRHEYKTLNQVNPRQEGTIEPKILTILAGFPPGYH
ncbi:MAG: hypothetical protein ABSD49_10805 [Candidatus Bathyarchaeia archaeon]